MPWAIVDLGEILSGKTKVSHFQPWTAAKAEADKARPRVHSYSVKIPSPISADLPYGFRHCGGLGQGSFMHTVKMAARNEINFHVLTSQLPGEGETIVHRIRTAKIPPHRNDAEGVLQEGLCASILLNVE